MGLIDSSCWKIWEHRTENGMLFHEQDPRESFKIRFFTQRTAKRIPQRN